MTSRLLPLPLKSVVLLCLSAFAFHGAVEAAGPRILPEGQVPNDRRLEPAKDLNGYFPFIVPDTKDAWEERREELRRRVLVATGLWPMPEKTPLNPSIYGRVDREGFTVEKVYFESCPNHFVTGLLFRPKGKTGRLPAVLCPHGHGGRLQDYGEKKIRSLLIQGAERFEASGRYPKLARCAQLARMGCVTFIFDMIGYADSVQISRQLAHGFSKQRPDFDTKESWGFFSTQAELRMQSIMGLQTWNSIRGLDFLCSLPDVDPQRIGVTGGSGGGTQTILLGAIDERPIVAFPQGMVSTAMQGGCTCENCCLLRVGTGNVELTALFAPKPQGMTAANDWTKEMMTKGYPELQQLYQLIGAKNNVTCKSMLHFPHNYNYVTRAMMYSWFNKHMKLGLPEPIVEEDYRPLTPVEYTVWDDEHPQPEGGDEYERSLIKWMTEQSDRQIAALAPKDADSLANYREVVGQAFDTIIGRALWGVGELGTQRFLLNFCDDYVEQTCLLEAKDHGESLPIVRLSPRNAQQEGSVVIWVDGDGKRGLYDDDGSPRPEVRKLMAAGNVVVGVDLLYQGEFLADGKPLTETPVVKNPRQYAGYTFGYNHTVFASRVHDILTVLAYVHGLQPSPKQDDILTLSPLVDGQQPRPKQVALVGLNGAGPLAAAAAAQAGAAVERVAVDTGGFRFVNLTSYRDPNFIPGPVKYGDLPALLALGSPHKLWLAGEKKVPDIVAAAYHVDGKDDSVTLFSGSSGQMPQAVADWLLAE